MSKLGTKRICNNGHQYLKSSDCPICPICEKLRQPSADFFKPLSAPARRALESIKINSLLELSNYSEKDIKSLHGMGPKALTYLKESLKSAGLSFK